MQDLDSKVLKLIYQENRPLKIGELKELLQLPHSTIGSCVKRLKKSHFVEYRAYHTVSLTDKGLDLARELIRHMQLLEVMLYNELGLSVDQAHAESEKFNLLFSCDIINKICEKYNHPNKCPCGHDIIPSQYCYCDKDFEKVKKK